MDFESGRTRELGCWDAPELLTPNIDAWTTNESTLEFEPDTTYCDFLIDIGFGKNCPSDARDFWRKTIKSNYQGDDGRERIRMAAINLRERDGLHGRLFDVRCPVLWLHGTSDAVYSVENARDEIILFKNAPEAKLETVADGQHFLSFSHPEEVAGFLVDFVDAHKGR